MSIAGFRNMVATMLRCCGYAYARLIETGIYRMASRCLTFPFAIEISCSCRSHRSFIEACDELMFSKLWIFGKTVLVHLLVDIYLGLMFALKIQCNISASPTF